MNIMGIKLNAIIYLSICLIAIILFFLRDDKDKYIIDIKFIINKGTFIHKFTLYSGLLLILPFTIPYSIRKILKK